MPHSALRLRCPAPLGWTLCCSAIGKQWPRTHQRRRAGAATLCLTLLLPFMLLELPLQSAAQQHAEGAPIKGARKGEGAGAGVGGRWFGAFFGGERRAQDAVIMRPSIVNLSALVQIVQDERGVNGSFVIANFFSSSCPFSAELEPLFNALPQVFGEQVRFIAMDAQANRGLNMRYNYGIGGYPSIVCFRRGRVHARFYDKPSLDKLIEFVNQNTNSTPRASASDIRLDADVGAQSALQPASNNLHLYGVVGLASVSMFYIIFDAWRVACAQRHDKDQ